MHMVRLVFPSCKHEDEIRMYWERCRCSAGEPAEKTLHGWGEYWTVLNWTEADGGKTGKRSFLNNVRIYNQYGWWPNFGGGGGGKTNWTKHMKSTSWKGFLGLIKNSFLSALLPSHIQLRWVMHVICHGSTSLITFLFQLREKNNIAAYKKKF